MKKREARKRASEKAKATKKARREAEIAARVAAGMDEEKKRAGIYFDGKIIPPPVNLPPVPTLLPPIGDEKPSILDGKFSVRSSQERKLDEIKTIIGELHKREREALGLYEPLPLQAAFHASKVKTRLVRGSNRAGKTIVCAVEVARAVLGLDPFGKYPKRGIAYIVGYDWSHHGQVTYPKIFSPGAFKCIEDEATGLLRAFRPWDLADALRRGDAVDAGPLIPERYVQDIAWYSKKEQIPNMIRMTTGWEIHFFSGDGRPPRGQAISLAWMDEEIGNQFWYNELVSRTADLEGRIMWSAAPQSGTDQLYELHELAEQQVNDADRVVEEFHVKLMDNPHLTAKQKAEMIAGKTTEAARITDIEGDFLFTTQRVFGEYILAVHGVEISVIPDTWTRYAVIDPGHQICAVLFGAVPPPDEQDEYGKLVLYDELYIQRCTASMLADRMRGKTAGQRFWDFIIDLRAGRQTSNQTGKTTAQQYSEAFQAAGVACTTRGSGFCWGSDDIPGRLETCRGLLRVDGNGRTGLRVACERTAQGYRVSKIPNFEYEIARYRTKRDPKTGVVSDVPDDRGRVHLMAGFQYLAAYQPKWHEQAPMQKAESEVYKRLQEKRRQHARMMAGGRPIGIRLGVGRTD